MAIYYPLAVGNTWTYKTKDGKTFTNSVTAGDGHRFTMKNTMIDRPSAVQKDGEAYSSDNFEAGNLQIFLKDNHKKGETWDIKYKANNFENVLKMTVKETGVSKTVEGKMYTDVVMLEGDMKIKVNGNLMSANYLVQYYYAPGVGLILTTSSLGDAMSLTSYELK
jgi:hypothetical protein